MEKSHKAKKDANPTPKPNMFIKVKNGLLPSGGRRV
jgi:hypothetical protein